MFNSGDWRGEEVQGNSVRLATQSDSDKWGR